MRQAGLSVAIMRLAGTVACLVAIVVGQVVPARAGNPLQTNDPETPGMHGWEINISHDLFLTHRLRLQEIPLININYGYADNDQWKISFRLDQADSQASGSQWGMGDVQLGWKYRFLEEDEYGFMASVYPEPLLPTRSSSLGLGYGRAELLLPVQAGKHFCDEKLFLYGEAGYNIVFDGSGDDGWFFGGAAEWRVTEKITLVGEVADLVFPHHPEADDPFFNVGFNYELTKHVYLQTAFGRSFCNADREQPFFTSYVGLHILWGGKSGTEKESPRCWCH